MLTIVDISQIVPCVMKRVSKKGSPAVYWCSHCRAIRQTEDCAVRAASNRSPGQGGEEEPSCRPEEADAQSLSGISWAQVGS